MDQPFSGPIWPGHDATRPGNDPTIIVMTIVVLIVKVIVLVSRLGPIGPYWALLGSALPSIIRFPAYFPSKEPVKNRFNTIASSEKPLVSSDKPSARFPLA